MQRVLLLLLTRIIRRIDVVELQRRHPVNLNHRLSRSRSIMVHARIKIRETPSRKAHHLTGIERVPHPYFQRARQHCDVLPVRMRMRSNLVPIRHGKANREIAGRRRRISLEHRDLRPRRYKRRRRTPLHLIGCEGVLRL